MTLRSLIIAAIVVVTAGMLACGPMEANKYIKRNLEPHSLYRAYGVKHVDLGSKSKCPSPASVKLMNAEKRTTKYSIFEMGGSTIWLTPKQTVSDLIGYLGYTLKKWKIKVDDKSDKVIMISLEEARIIFKCNFCALGGYARIKVKIPAIKFEKSYAGKDWTGDSGFVAVAYGLHLAVFKMLKDPVVLNYILCRKAVNKK